MCFSKILIGYICKQTKPYSSLIVNWNNHFLWMPTHAIIYINRENYIEKRRYCIVEDANHVTFKIKNNKVRYVKVLIRFEGFFGCAKYKKIKIDFNSKIKPVHDIKYQILETYTA